MATPGYQPPRETYYPSCVVDLRIRFDDAYTVTKSGAVAVRPGSVSLLESPTYLAVRGIQERMEAGDTGIPLFISPDNGDGLSHVLGRIPMRASVELPAYRQAGTFHLTFDYKDLPIDPRLIRACGVSIYMDTVTAAGFSQGATGKTALGQPPSFIGDNKRSSIMHPTTENLVLVGVVDNWSVDHTSKGSTVTIEGRDQRSILLNSPLNPELFSDLNLDQPIDVVVQQIIDRHGGLGMINVKADDAAYWPNQEVPSPVAADEITAVPQPEAVAAPVAKRRPVRPRHRKVANGKGWRSPAKGMMNNGNYWDLIVNYCALVGAVPYFIEENIIRIRPGRNLFDQTLGNAPAYKRGANGEILFGASTPTAFRGGSISGRDVGEAAPIRIRRMVFGHNVEEMLFERKFLGIYGRTLKVYSFDTSSTSTGTGKLRSATYPTTEDFEQLAKERGWNPGLATDAIKAKNTREDPSGQTSVQEEIIIYVKGVTDEGRLRDIAIDLWNEMMRGEQGGSIKTKSLASFGGDNADPDLLYMRPGDSVELVVDSRPLSNRALASAPLTEQERGLSDGKLYQSLKEKLGDANLAAAIVASLKNYAVQLQNVYRVKDVKLDWNIGSGVSIAFNFQNYIIPRHGLLPSPSLAGGTTEGKTVAPPAGTTGVPR